jgi:tetratricopeptide (TPR) repeat protein
MEAPLARTPRRPAQTRRYRVAIASLTGVLFAVLGVFSPFQPRASGAELETARAQLAKGEYAAATRILQTALEERPRGDDWHIALIQALLAQGLYPEAQTVLTNALARSNRSLPLYWLARDVFRANGHPDRAAEIVEEIPKLVSQRPWSFRDAENLIPFGRAMLTLGADPKEVLDKVFATAKRASPELLDLYLASGELALEKNDFALAAKHFDDGLKHHPKNPDLLQGRARAFAGSDREEAAKMLQAALAENPRHAPTLLLLADHRIDSEDYPGATEVLKEIRKTNPWNPEAWSYSAVIAHLQNDPSAEQEARTAALRYWTNNPNVPHLIGRKLSQKYRFTEGAELQREALRQDPEFIPAKAQLATDLLRLGENDEGWSLAQEVHEADAYDIAAYNLVTLKDTMASFVTLTNEHFILRMSTNEAAIYGSRVLQLLERARATLVPKYGLELTTPTTVEIFPEQKDFGVRTFGMPDNPGYLGVCFGKVITANSPASSRGNPVNWEAVLWHEYCHVVTLQLTANKMPRWLSEGISVYEEREADPAWGEQLIPKYREMILDGELTPVGRLSAAFLIPKTPQHLQFAYYQSSLVVEFLIQRHGIEAIRKILADLKAGTFINDAIARHTVAMDALEKDFATFAKAKAESLGPGLDWEKPAPAGVPAALGDLARRITAPSTDTAKTNYWLLLQSAGREIEAKNWAGAKVPLQQLVTLHPTDTGPSSAYAMLARAHRELGEAAEERDILSRWAAIDAEALEAYLRLMDIAADASDWPEVRRNAERYLAVNPLVAAPYRRLAEASESAQDLPTAIASYRTLLRLDPPNPPEVHYPLAKLLHESGDPGARRHVLQALEDAPRHRAALQLLLQMGEPPPAPTRAKDAWIN